MFVEFGNLLSAQFLEIHVSYNIYYTESNKKGKKNTIKIPISPQWLVIEFHNIYSRYIIAENTDHIY